MSRWSFRYPGCKFNTSAPTPDSHRLLLTVVTSLAVVLLLFLLMAFCWMRSSLGLEDPLVLG